MHRVASATAAIALLVGAVFVSTAGAGHGHGKGKPAKGSFERVVFVEYAKGAKGAPAGGALSTDFHVSKTPLGQNLAYSISTSGCSPDCGGAAATVGASFSDWGVSGLSLTQSGSPDTNPCGGVDSVSWSSIDGPGGILGETFVCAGRGHGGTIVGFQTIFDSGDAWSTCGSVSACDSAASGDFSVAAVAAHESGHVYGLEHDHAPRDSRLTMFYALSPNDYGLATLGCGDLLGVNALYGTSLDCNSVPND